MKLPSNDFLNQIILNRSSVGIVILDNNYNILYLNDEAHSIFSAILAKDLSLDKSNPSQFNKLVVSTIKNNLGDLSELSSACISHPNNDSTYALRTLPLFEPDNKRSSCTLIMIEGVTMHHKFDIKTVQKKFGFTKRETEVTFCLTKGFTNKEIAQALSLSPETVHGYVKQIMKKMRTTTRAGIVGKVLP